jgi:hypothetical protein
MVVIMTETPHHMPGSPALRIWLILSFIVDMIFGIPLLLVPHDIAAVFQFEDQGLFVLRLIGAALIGIGMGSVLVVGERGQRGGFEAIVNLKLVWTIFSVIGIGLSISDGAPKSAWLFFAIFCVFAIGWIYHAVQLRKGS